MLPDELKQIFDFEANLEIGDTVLVRWTWSYRQYQSLARVLKKNRSSIRVELLERVMYTEQWEAPSKISVPSIEAFKLYSVNNRIEPSDGSWSWHKKAVNS